MPKKSRKVLMMMMKATKLGWVGAGQEKGWSKARAGLKHEQGRIRSRAEQSKAEQAETGQELGRNWGGMCRIGA